MQQIFIARAKLVKYKSYILLSLGAIFLMTIIFPDLTYISRLSQVGIDILGVFTIICLLVLLRWHFNDIRALIHRIRQA